jgi:D-aminoacyl-tRNA deacylase
MRLYQNGNNMRTVIQRVRRARVKVADETVGEIGPGLLVLVGIHRSDGFEEADWIVRKIAGLRIFDDESGKMNRNVVDAGGALLLVSQFTLYGDATKGNRPSYSEAAAPEAAQRLYDYVVTACRERCKVPVETGVFQAQMEVELVNDGPVTICCEIESKDRQGNIK